MDAQNPYAAPRADLGQVNLAAGDLSGAIAEFQASRAPMLGVAIALIAMSVIGCLSTLSTMVMLASDLTSGIMLPYLSIVMTWIGDIAAAVLLLWVHKSISKLATSPQGVTVVMSDLARFWLIATILWAVPSLATVGVSILQFILPVVGAALVATMDDPVRAASRWRNGVRAAVILGAALLLGKAATQLFGPMSDIGSLYIRVWLFGGIAVQLALGVIIWRQVPPLEAFIASPTPANLTAVAHAHRTTWRLLLFTVIGAFALNMVATMAMRFIGW